MNTAWLNDRTFRGRRLTCIYLPLTTLYMLGYGDYPYSRTIDETKDENTRVYCLDLIVKNHEELLPALNSELAKHFDLQAKIEPMVKEVNVLHITDAVKFRKLVRNSTGKRTYYARHGEIDQDVITMKDFAQFLENYDIGKLVDDETGNTERFNIKFSFQPEDPQSIIRILAGMGLVLTKEERNVDMLVLYK